VTAVVFPAFNLIPDEPIARTVELAALGERLGYQRGWLYDEGLATRELYVTMTAVALATSTLEIGPGITNPYTRHIGVTASAVATLDELSGGRAFLGIGAGGSLTLDPLAIERAKPLSAVREAIAACRRLFAGEAVTVDGHHVRLRNAALPAARADLEIWLAGRGPLMLELGGASCDGVLLDFVHKPDLGAIAGRLRDAGEGRSSPPRIAYSTMLVTDDASMAAVKPHMTYRLVDSPSQVQSAIGLSEAEAATIRSAMAEGLQAAASHVRDEWVLPFVLSGSVSECASELDRLVDRHGIDSFVVPLLDDASAERSLRIGAQILRL